MSKKATKRKTLSMYENAIKKVRFKGTSQEDMEAYYKAYLMDSFVELHPEFSSDSNFDKEMFEKAFSMFMEANNLLSITFYGFDNDVEIPIGVLTFWQHGRILHINHMVWFPWSSNKHKFLNLYNFFESIRHSTDSSTGLKRKVVGHTAESSMVLFDKLIDMGILNKIGKDSGFLPNEDVVFLSTKEVING